MPARWPIAALIALAALLRLPTLGSQSLWQDEAYTYALATRPFGDMLRGVADTETTPALFYAATWTWYHFLGGGDAGLRAISVLAGLALIPVAYAYGRRLAGQSCGIVLAGIAAASPLLVWYSQEARAYALATLFAGLGWVAFLRVLDRPRPEAVAWWALAGAAVVATHYTAAYFVGVQGLWLVAARPGLWRALVPAGAALGLVGAALAVTAAVQATPEHTLWIAAIPLDARAEGAVTEALVGPVSAAWHPSVVIGLIVATAATFAVWRDDARRVYLPAVLSVAAAGLVLLTRELGSDYFLGRNLIFGWLPLAGVVAAGVASLPRRWMVAAGGAVVCVPMLVVTLQNLTDDRMQRPDWRAVARAIGPAREPRLVISADGYGSRPLRVYLPAHEVGFGAPHAVREIVAVTADTSKFNRPCGGGALCGTPPTTPGAIPGFAAVQRRRVAGGRFLVTWFRSRRRVPVEPSAAAATAIQPREQVTTAYVQVP